MNRSETDKVKVHCKELLHRIAVMESVAGWHRYDKGLVLCNFDSKPSPEDIFEYGQYTASVKRASMDLTRSLVELRR